MTLVAFGLVLLVSVLAGFLPAIAANLPTILGAVVGILTVFLTGHALDQKWTIGQAPPQLQAKPSAKKTDDEQEGS